jgi:hypothetical protein
MNTHALHVNSFRVLPLLTSSTGGLIAGADAPFQLILDGMAKAADNISHHAAKTRDKRRNTVP